MTSSHNCKTVIITGARSDIGGSLVTRFEREGYDLVLLSRKGGDVAEFFPAGQSPGIRTDLYQVDFEHDEKTKNIFEEISRKHDDIGIMINNAALTMPGGVTDYSESELERMFRVNFYTPLMAARIIIPGMIRRGGGDIVNIASVAGLKGVPGAAGYSASKAALINLTDAINGEFSKMNIRSMAICPETVNTSFLDTSELSDDYRERLLQPEDIAAAVFNLIALPRHIHFNALSVKSGRT